MYRKTVFAVNYRTIYVQSSEKKLMRLPKEITPNPLLTSTVEIRFVSKLKEADLLSLFYPIFAPEFPKIKDNRLPKELKSQEKQLEFMADFVLSNDRYSLSFSTNAISFENIGTYHFWNEYFPMIKSNLMKLAKMNVFTSIIRVGVRYGSMFENKTSIGEILNKSLSLGYDGYEEKVNIFHTSFTKEKTTLILQILPDATVQHSNLLMFKDEQNVKPKTGFYIDIDSSCVGSDNLKVDEQLYGIIEALHLEGKTLFFSLLKPEFIDSLNPKY